MKNDFALLSEFLETLSPEVAGHSSSAPLSEEQTQMIGEFASGNLDEKQRSTLLPDLLENETALQTLVEAIREKQQA